jgi:hypothetical protein
MPDIKRALNNARLLRATIGLKRFALEALLPAFEHAYQGEQQQQTLAGQPQQCAF